MKDGRRIKEEGGGRGSSQEQRYNKPMHIISVIFIVSNVFQSCFFLLGWWSFAEESVGLGKRESMKPHHVP